MKKKSETSATFWILLKASKLKWEPIPEKFERSDASVVRCVRTKGGVVVVNSVHSTHDMKYFAICAPKASVGLSLTASLSLALSPKPWADTLYCGDHSLVWVARLIFLAIPREPYICYSIDCSQPIIYSFSSIFCFITFCKKDFSKVKERMNRVRVSRYWRLVISRDHTLAALNTRHSVHTQSTVNPQPLWSRIR